ncbi:FAD-dependent oxidoreductase [Pseudonocardia dioxanivorans]|uniref:FAD-dependent oxidoreductase n=1 Tax=Pseudonocardia dioxanivorans TaxID=240495 RepID=UPI00131A4DFF|nr:FAD-dependent oxidoreductase [Pseudonocardia dioxanivorans]
MSDPDEITVDVLVVGAGPGGLAAAETAASRGASVLLVDAEGDIGGNAAFSTGYAAFAGTSLQAEQGIADSPAQLLADMRAEFDRRREEYPEAVFDEAVAARFATESAAAYDYLVHLGFAFDRIVSRPRQHRVDRTVVLSDPAQFRDVFAHRLNELGVRVLPHRRARELTTDASTVTGALVEGPGGTTTRVRAVRGVVLATGGYQASAELRARFRPDLDPTSPHPGLDGNLGDGQLMAEKIGAQLVNMRMVPEVVLVASRLVEDCIAVTEDGERFHDEAGPEHERLVALRTLPGAIAYYLCDARTAAGKAQLLADMPGARKQFDTLAGVARGIGAEPAVLAATMERWNAAVGAGADPEFGRVVFPRDGVGIVEPPFTVAPMVVGTNISSGGVRVSQDMQALDAAGLPIPNLFAVGDCTGSINATVGLGGLHLAAGITLGRVAGRGAAGG